MSKIAWWRTLPPAGPPLPIKSLINSFISTINHKEIKEKLIKQLKDYFNASHVFLTDSGRSGLSLSLMALHNLLPKDMQASKKEVLIPAYVSYSVPSAVVHAGFKIRFYDVDADTLSPNYTSMKDAVSDKTLAIVICHQFGLPFSGAQAKEIAKEAGTYLIDDAAQAMGGLIEQKQAGCMGDIGLFSLSRGKPLTSVEGGILLTNSSDIAESIQSTVAKLYSKAHLAENQGFVADIKNMIKALALYILRRPTFYTIPASMPWLNIGASTFEPNFPDGEMSPFRMALCSESLPLLKHANVLRTNFASRYTQLTNKQDELRAIAPSSEAITVYLRYPVLPQKGYEDFIQKILSHNNGLSARRLGISRGFPKPLYAVEELKPYLADFSGDPKELYSGALYLAENLITLPTHDMVTNKDFNIIADFFSEISSKK